QNELASLESDASAAVSRLEATRAARSSYLTQMAAQRQLNSGRISDLEAQAREAQVAAQNLAAANAATAPAGLATEPAAAAQGGQTLTVLATGYSLQGRTATGMAVGYGVVAVDPSVIPLGTRLSIPGYGEGVAADVGAGIQGASIDLWFPTVAQALAW